MADVDAGLFPDMVRPEPRTTDMVRPEPRTTGILPSQEIRDLVHKGKILSSVDIEDNQIQPASIDLRLGAIAYRVLASFIPGRESTVETKIKDLQLATLDLRQPSLLEAGAVFIIPLMESLALPPDISAKANPKSTTGRLDIFTRLITDCGDEFERVRKGYSGPLYVQVVARTFPIIVQTGTKLNQLRFVRGNPLSTADGPLKDLATEEKLVFDNGDEPVDAIIRGGLRISIDLAGIERGRVIAYRAKHNPPPVDLSKVGGHDAADFWDAITSPPKKTLVLNPRDFYLLASRERVRIPLAYAAEMEPFDMSLGEFTIHYAGFFDPGFGYGASGEITGTKAVLEVRAHEVPMLLEDRQIVARLIYHNMMKTPEKVYGQGIGSSYQQQGLALSKQFRITPTTELTAHRT